MKYNIRHLSCYAENILQRLKTGTIHSVYRRTINLTDGRNILSLQSEHSPLSPISLISGLPADDLNSLDVRAGDTVLFGKEDFTLRGAVRSYHFITTDAQRCDLKLSGPMDVRTCTALTSNIRTALSVAETGGFALLFGGKSDTGEDLSLILLAAQKYIRRCSELCIGKDYQKAALELSRLLGLGIGLTPSGDDFLCGVFAGLHLSGNSGHPFTHCLKTEVRSRLSDTIDISAAFLSCALEDQFSLPVNNLYRLPAPEAILAAFSEIGHSSGTDTLCGVLWSLEHI